MRNWAIAGKPGIWSTDFSQTKLWLVKMQCSGSSGDQTPPSWLFQSKDLILRQVKLGGPSGNMYLMNFVQSSFFLIKKRKKSLQKIWWALQSLQLFSPDWLQAMVETTRLLIKLLTLSSNLHSFEHLYSRSHPHSEVLKDTDFPQISRGVTYILL